MLQVGLLNCTKEQHDNKEKCELIPEEETFICNFEVVEQAWLNHREVVRANCRRGTVPPVLENVNLSDEMDDDSDEIRVDAVRRKREAPAQQVLGGPRDAEESAETLLELAKFAIQQLDAIDADDEARLVMEVLNSKKKASNL